KNVIAIHFDTRQFCTYSTLWSELGIVLGFCALFLLQVYLGPALTTATMIMVAYYFFQYHEFYLPPFIQSTVDIIASVGPDWSDNTYTLIMGSYTAVTSLKDTIA